MSLRLPLWCTSSHPSGDWQTTRVPSLPVGGWCLCSAPRHKLWSCAEWAVPDRCHWSQGAGGIGPQGSDFSLSMCLKGECDTVVLTAVKTNVTAVCLSVCTPIGTSWLINKTDRLYLRVTCSGIRNIAAECSQWEVGIQTVKIVLSEGVIFLHASRKEWKKKTLLYLQVHHEYKKGNLKLGMLLC